MGSPVGAGPPPVQAAWETVQPPPPTYPPPKRPRLGDNPSQVDTVAIVGAAEQGFDQASLQDFFSQLPGFIAFKANSRMGGGFVKFESPTLAAQAMATAYEQGIPADMAKSNMSSVN